MTEAEIVAQRRAIVRELNRNGYSARKFTDGERGFCAIEKGDIRGPYVRITVTQDEEAWAVRCHGISELINPMAVIRHCENALEKANAPISA